MAELSASEDTARPEMRAAAMFGAALAFLVLLALLIPHGGVASRVSGMLSGSPWLTGALFVLWGVIVAEGIAGWLAAPDRKGKALGRLGLVAAIPPFRMTMSPLRPNTEVWLPRLGWLRTGKQAVAAMEERAALPMLVVTALILPVIVADFTLKPTPHETLEAQFEHVARFDLSNGSDRLYLLDANEVALANFVRPDDAPLVGSEIGIEGLWIMPGEAQEEDATALSFWPDMRFSFRTGCAVTQGVFESGGTALHFTEVDKIAVCPPTVLEWTIYLITALIWFSFALEFVLLVSLAEKKLAFCKKHWINIVIILLPLLAFLRSFQIFRFLRMARAGKLMRAYRLKGLVTRIAKLAVLFNLVERMLSRDPEKYTAHLDEKIADAEAELEALRARRAEVKAQDA